jgi:putative transposase
LVSCYRLIEAERTSFSVPLMCRTLGVSRSGYYDWRDRPLSRRRREGIVLTAKVRRIHERSRQTYGSPRVQAELRPIGTRCSRKRVARLMREAGLQGCMRGGRKRTTRRSKGAPPAEELVKRNFAATEMDRAWVADITYVHTWDGFL